MGTPGGKPVELEGAELGPPLVGVGLPSTVGVEHEERAASAAALRNRVERRIR